MCSPIANSYCKKIRWFFRYSNSILLPKSMVLLGVPFLKFSLDLLFSQVFYNVLQVMFYQPVFWSSSFSSHDIPIRSLFKKALRIKWSGWSHCCTFQASGRKHWECSCNIFYYVCDSNGSNSRYPFDVTYFWH